MAPRPENLVSRPITAASLDASGWPLLCPSDPGRQRRRRAFLERVLSTRHLAAPASSPGGVCSHGDDQVERIRSRGIAAGWVLAVTAGADPGYPPTVEDRSADDAGASPGVEQGSRGVRLRTLDALYRSQAARLMRLFNRRGHPQDAADLVHETFTRFAQATLERDAAPQCPESYLRTVAVNVLRDRGRSPAYRAALHAIPVEDVELIGADDEAAHHARDMLARVEAALLALKPVTREIFIARRYHGYSRAEIAAQAGLSLKAIDKHLARAVEHLYRHFGHCDDI